MSRADTTGGLALDARTRVQRLAAVVAVVLGLGGLGIVAREQPVTLASSFASLGAPTMPFVPTGSFITSSWFCPGVPTGGQGAGGDLAVTNPGDVALVGAVTVFTTEPGVEPVIVNLEVAGRDTATVDLRAAQPVGEFVSAVVEIDGGGGFVEQRARHPLGDSVSPCSNATSATWYFADGYTAEGSTERLVLTNPSPDAATVDIGFTTADGIRNPSRLQGYPVPGRSVRVVELGARDEPVLAARVIASRGRVVAARAQVYAGANRDGFSMTLGAPSLSSQAWFADGEVADGVRQSFSVFNPSESDVTVDVLFLGVAVSEEFTNDTELVVPAGRVVTLDTADVAGLPEGRHGAVFSTFAADSIVVERVITRPAGDEGIATTVVLGSPPQLASTRWSSAVGTDVAIDDGLVVLNADSVDTTVRVLTLGPGGLVPVPGLDAVALPAAGVITIPLDDPSVIGRAFVVESGQRVYVERLLPRGAERRGRTGSFALSG